jgi:hypothetical protein
MKGVSMSFIKSLVMASAIIASSMSVAAETKITVSHPEIAAPTYIDHGKPGQSIGDIRIWQFEAKANDGALVTTDWILTTTGVAPDSGMEYRITSAVFSFGEGTSDQIVIQGVAQYPSVKATLDQSVPTRRAITGGTGKFAGAGGWVESTHLPNGAGWQHVLHLK